MNNYTKPTAEGQKSALANGWSQKQSERGYDIFDFNGLGLLQIEAICDCYPADDYSDEACAYEAQRTGFCKIIPVEELPDSFVIGGISRRYFGWIDTPENRERIKNFAMAKEHEVHDFR